MNWRAFLSGIAGGLFVVATLSFPQIKAQTPWAAYPVGVVTLVIAGSCPPGTAEIAALNGSTLFGTLAANGDVGTTGGANTITPTVASLTAAAQTFTGSSAATSAVSAGTPTGTNSSGSFTEGAISYPVNVPTIAAGTFTQSTISWPASVPTFAGTAFSSVINHTHTVTVTYQAQGGTTASTAGTHSMTSTATGGSARSLTSGDVVSATTANPSGGVSSITPTGTVAWPAGVPTNASGSFSEGAISWPANPPTIAAGTLTQPTFTGNALGTHTHTLTATGTNAASVVTGTLNSFDNRPAFMKVIFCQKS